MLYIVKVEDGYRYSVKNKSVAGEWVHTTIYHCTLQEFMEKLRSLIERDNLL
jgi:predicted SpoU family rRNA methylase